MAMPAEDDQSVKFDEILARMKGQPRADLAARFAATLFAQVDMAEFAAYTVDELSAIAAQGFEHLLRRRPGEPKVDVREHKAGATSFTIVDIVNDDMPFLLDSVLGQLRDMGLTPELVAHPIFAVQRDAAGELTALHDASNSTHGLRRESFIHLHLRRIENEGAREALLPALLTVLGKVKTVVSDFQTMRGRLNGIIAEYQRNLPPAPVDVTTESILFLKWLASNFTFLGIREYRYLGDSETGQLQPVDSSGLGLLRDPEISVLRRGGEDKRLTDESRRFFLNSPPVIVAKANSVSSVHRRVHMDTVGIKLYDTAKRITGEVRIAGLFTATTYNASTRNIPLLRLKVDQILRHSGHSLDSYSGRALLNVLETFPRDELFQIPVERLASIASEILKLELTPRPRVFVRRDEFGRFLSVFVYVPRERFNTDTRVRIISMLEDAINGQFDAFTPFFSEGATVRLHIVIWRRDSDLRAVDELDLERKVESIVRTWRDELRDRLTQHYGEAGYSLIDRYSDAFPVGYEETNRPHRALEDIARLEKLSSESPVVIDLYRDDRDNRREVRATLQQLDEPVALSKRVPILENLGFNVISERTFKVSPKIGGARRVIFLHDSLIEQAIGDDIDIYAQEDGLEQGFLAVWHGRAANDKFNGLILSARLNWHEAALMRAYGAYLRQSGAPFGLAYVAQVLNKHPSIAADLVELFHTLFDPALGLGEEERGARHARIAARIQEKLEAIPVLDEDRVLRRFLTMIEATLRTNFYQRTPTGGFNETIAFKLHSGQIDWLPDPKPYAEIFVTSPRFEGIHLRGGPIARGGLRWSDRPQDFRTEVLSLAKAQQVKNTVIVPQGAKGGFVPRKAMNGKPREEVLAEGIACYKAFVSTLLSITDNLVQGEIVPPANTIRRDGDDPYLVVAADKGTATFSDIANEIAVGRGFWLGDAFASGGSAGYDHKKMAITARGAWEAVKRHFREMNIDIQSQPFTVAGVGDMSGDVFGNGMLLSRAIRLVAAFDHRDIFIDPNPDPEVSYAERQRLFQLPRSSWQDYDTSKLSEGGAIYSRSAKYITLSPQAQALLDLGAQVTPQDIMTAILKADVDLMWFGGIGTFVRASSETDAQAGDRTNDAIRITGADIRAKVIGEGANLGLTQKARIEYALHGGRLNTDAIDNSAGVNSSDYEVNIKIAFGGAISAGRIDIAERNRILTAMTDQVAAAVLRNNYLQTLAISLGERRGLSDFGFQQLLMRKLEAEGILDRSLEALPNDLAIAERRAAGKALTRPELAVLLAYAKLSLHEDLIRSDIPSDPYLGRELFSYFPEAMRERFADEIAHHPLRREIIATVLANDIINRGGSTFVVRLVEETGHSPADIAYAFTAAKDVYGLDDLYAAIDALDGKIDGGRQLDLYRDVQDLLRRQAAWFLRHGDFSQGLEPEIARYREGVNHLTRNMAEALPDSAEGDLHEVEAALLAEHIPHSCALRLAAIAPLAQALDIAMAANKGSMDVIRAARILFEVRDAFKLHELTEASEALGAGDYFDRLAVNSTLASISAAQRAITGAVIEKGGANADFETWRQANAIAVERVSRSIADILESGPLTLAKLTVAVAQLRDVARV